VTLNVIFYLTLKKKNFTSKIIKLIIFEIMLIRQFKLHIIGNASKYKRSKIKLLIEDGANEKPNIFCVSFKCIY